MPKVIENECVFQAVMQVMLERGYAGATTKQMAEAAGVSEVTLFRKFVSKPQLVKQAIAWLARQMDFIVAAEYTGDVTADLLRIVQAYQNTAVQYGPFFAVIFSEMPRNPELVGIIDEPVRIFAALGDLLVHYQDDGILLPEHPYHALAVLLGPLMYSSLIRAAISSTPIPPLDLSDHVARFLDGRRLG